ncbi:MAG: diguanylate cyclase, partial [Gemmatimonadota bacterium]|nr:diguanylate cyclase [Gemmatimonadota bacterium]
MALPKRSDTFSSPALICFAPDGCHLPDPVAGWLAQLGGQPLIISNEDELMSFALRSRPGVVIFDARNEGTASLSALQRLKADSYTAVVPCAVVAEDGAAAMEAAFAAGADEVLRVSTPTENVTPRLDAMIRRSERDLSVHPSTRLAGAAAIEVEIGKRLATGEAFAVCYADLDHFKEFNDRYSYNQGDRVIRILAKLLH